ncbi:MAG: hypothetical protein ACJAXK_002592 [Yoonia sp.]|jgi:hypothetical protein
MTLLNKIITTMTTPAQKTQLTLKAAVSRADVARITSIGAYS